MEFEGQGSPPRTISITIPSIAGFNDAKDGGDGESTVMIFEDEEDLLHSKLLARLEEMLDTTRLSASSGDINSFTKQDSFFRRMGMQAMANCTGSLPVVGEHEVGAPQNNSNSRQSKMEVMERTQNELVAILEKMRGALKSTQIQLMTEKSNRKTREKTLFKLAKELGKRRETIGEQRETIEQVRTIYGYQLL
jgi:hypothetical protein